MEVGHTHDSLGGGALDEPTPPVSLCGSLLREHRHVCAFFNSRDDEYCVTLPFIRDGLNRGDKAYHLVGPDRRDDHLRRLSAADIDVAALQQSGQFQLQGWTRAISAARGGSTPTNGSRASSRRCRAVLR